MPASSSMQYGQVPGVDKSVSRLVLGTMIINTRELESSFALLDSAFEQGYNTLDTAHVYAGGDSERAIGRWLKARGNREKVVIISKGAHPNADRWRVTPFDITADLTDSLARLQTDYIDIYLLHRDDPEVPVGPIVEVLNEHYEAGKIRAFGGSNWRHERIQAANDYAAAHNLQPFVASSPNFSLAEQLDNPWGPGCVSISGPREAEAREWYRRGNMPIFAYSSLARGLFSGRITRENYHRTKEQLDKACRRAYCHEPNFERLERARRLAEVKGVSVPQVALAYLFHHGLNVFALVGAASPAELADNLPALDIKLTAAELSWLDLTSDVSPI